MKKAKKKSKPKQLPFKEQLHTANLTIERVLEEVHRAIGLDKVYAELLSSAEYDLEVLEMELEEEKEFCKEYYPADIPGSRAHLADLKKAKTASLKAIKLLEKFIEQKKIADKLWLGC
jgi:hypothetical protein